MTKTKGRNKTLKPVILLDLNCTLVEGGVKSNISKEVYRGWLVEVLKGYHTILVTARNDKHSFDTLARIREQTGWLPQEWYFNREGWPPSIAKDKALQNYIFPKHGIHNIDSQYIAIESNQATRKMYGRYGIESLWVEDEIIWTSLKDWTEQFQVENGSLTQE